MGEVRTSARALVDRYWEALLEHDPLLGTVAGDERYDDRLPDPSEAGRVRRETLHRSALGELSGIDRNIDEEGLRTALDILEAVATAELAGLEHRLDRLRTVSHFWGPAQLLGELGVQQRADTPERLERYLARLAGTPAYYEALAEVMRDGVAAGVTAPRVVVERTIGQVQRLLAAPPEESPALEAAPPEDTAGRERVLEALREHALPALTGFLEALRDYLPSATETLGLYALPGGEAMYAAEILSWTTLPLEASKVHDLGLEDMEKIQEERRLCAERLGYPDVASALSGIDDSGRNRARTKDELRKLVEEQVRRSWEAAPRFFGRMPSHNCEVRLVEEFREADMAGAFYLVPTEDGSRRGIYYVNGFGLEDRPLHHMATTTFHEANPGHHFQLTIEMEMGERPPLRKFAGMLTGSAFVEGWGLYCERLADEMGLYLDDVERMGMLEAQAWRAARLVVDTGIHAFGWSREQAIAKLEEAGVPRLDAEIETDRYITMPGQALTYKIGQFEIERQRAAAAQRDGAAVSLRDFHDRLLALGSLPLTALRRELG